MRAESSNRRAPRITFALVGALVAAVAVAGLSGSATASHPQTPWLYGCALKSNGLARYVADVGECRKQETSFAVWPGPTDLCIKPDGSVRQVSSPADCGTGPPNNRGTPLTVPSSIDAYFCASGGGILRHVASPAECTEGETALVVANHAPTDIALSNDSVAENEPVGTTVGTLSATDPDPAASFTFSLVAGTGDADNASFQIDGSTLKTNAIFDYETKNSFSIRVRVTDGYGGSYEEAFTISVTDVVENAAPTDIQLSNASVAENQPAGTSVGTLTTTDPDAGDTHTYSLVAGAGDEDNAKFQLSGSTLQTSQPLDFEADSSLSVRIRTDDGNGGTFEKPFAITVTDANDAPTDIALSNASVAENQPAATNVGTLSATDQDAGATHTFTLVAGAGDEDNAKFQISGSTLQTSQPLDFEADPSLSVRVRADDGAGGTFEKSFTITVTNVNEAPTDITLSNSSVAENEPVGTTVGTFSATDPDAADTHTFALVAGAGDTDNASFQVDGATLKTNAVFDFETKSSYSIRVRTTDAGSLAFEKQFTITITNVNEAPSDINLSNSSIAENQAAGTAVGTLTTVDDPGSTHTYSLVAGTGDTDNASFQIDGDVLESAAVFDFEAKSSYSVRIRTDDGGGGTFEKQFTISITDANDAPSDIALSNASVNENEAVGTAVGTLSATDQDAADTHTFALVAGAGDTDNASFQIAGTALQTNAVFNFEAKSSYSIRVRVTDSGSATFEEQFTISIVDVNDAPTAVADSYGNAVGNTLAVLGTAGTGPHVVLTGNVVTNNDSDEDTTFPNTISAVAETVASTGGGSATINADGSFTFLPGVGDKNQVDTFTYHVTDGSLTSAGTVSITIADVLVWYVNGAAGAGDGRSSSPLNALAGINGAGGAGDADGTGDVIFLYSGTYGGGLPLEASQKLTGQPHGLTVNPGSGNVTLVPAGGTNPTIGNSGGAGIALANGVEIQRVNVNGTSGAGVTGTAITTATIGTNTSIGGATGNAFELSGAASGNIDVGAAITSSTARSLSVQNRSGGTVAISGSVTDTGQGILVSSNTGATVNLTGVLTLSTGANNALTATGGGTFTANAAANTIATTTGTALNVANTTIGAGGLMFRSISSNGAANGIVLNTTGSSGGLTVTGTGSAGTGGTIQNSSGAGIVLTSTRSPSFSWMTIQNGGDDGIRGSSVSNGFTLASSSVTGNGNAVTERGIELTNLTGTSSVTNSSVTGSAEDNLYVANTTGTLTLTVTGSTFSNTSAAVGNDGIHFLGNGTANMAISVSGSTFANNRGDHFQVLTDAASAATLDVVFENNTMTGAATNLGAGITINTGGTSSTTFDILDNGTALAPWTGAISSAITINTVQNATMSGIISGNVIGNPAVADSGSFTGDGVNITANATSDIVVAVTNNVIREYSNLAGINIHARDNFGNPGGGTINATVTGNTISDPGTFASNGILAQAGSVTGDDHFLCVDVGGAGALANSIAGSGANGGTDFRLRQRIATTVRLPGYAGGATDTAAVVAFVQGRNTGAETGSATVSSPPGGGFVGGAACSAPAS